MGATHLDGQTNSQGNDKHGHLVPSTEAASQRSIRILDNDKKRNKNAGSIKNTEAIL